MAYDLGRTVNHRIQYANLFFLKHKKLVKRLERSLPDTDDKEKRQEFLRKTIEKRVLDFDHNAFLKQVYPNAFSPMGLKA